jgi:hypothetical protein
MTGALLFAHSGTHFRWSTWIASSILGSHDRISSSLSYAITLAFFDMGARPNSDAAGYFSLKHPFAEALCEDHYDAPSVAVFQ